MAKNNKGKNKSKKSGMISVNETVAVNKRARFDYELGDTYEAGLQLFGTEVKSLRLGQASIAEAYIGPGRAENADKLYIFNANIPEYQQAGNHLQHDPKRTKLLLLHKREINALLGAVQKGGYTIVPTRLFFNGRGLAKLELALAKGKKAHDKRETEKKRDWGREKQRLLRER